MCCHVGWSGGEGHPTQNRRGSSASPPAAPLLLPGALGRERFWLPDRVRACAWASSAPRREGDPEDEGCRTEGWLQRRRRSHWARAPPRSSGIWCFLRVSPCSLPPRAELVTDPPCQSHPLPLLPFPNPPSPTWGAPSALPEPRVATVLTGEKETIGTGGVGVPGPGPTARGSLAGWERRRRLGVRRHPGVGSPGP